MVDLINSENKSKLFHVVATMLFVYITLFEFVLPVNKFMPKPTLVLESYSALILDYNLLGETAVTTAVIYLAIVFGYVLISLTAGITIRVFVEYPGLFNGLRVFRYFPAFFFAVVFALWFHESIIAESIFALFAVIFLYGLNLSENIKKVPQEYITSAMSLRVSKKKIYNDVIWKCCQPGLFGHTYRVHYYLWSLILIYEFINGAIGIGGIYNDALNYNDIAAVWALAILLSLLILIGKLIIEFFEKKLIYWEV